MDDLVILACSLFIAILGAGFMIANELNSIAIALSAHSHDHKELH